MPEQKKIRRNIIRIYLVTLGVGFAYFLFGKVTGWFMPCLLNKYTGLLCPGCGISRMFLSLAKLQIRQAFSYNPAVFVLLILWNIIGLLCFIGKPKIVRKQWFLYVSMALSVAALVLYGILRNFP